MMTNNKGLDTLFSQLQSDVAILADTTFSKYADMLLDRRTRVHRILGNIKTHTREFDWKCVSLYGVSLFGVPIEEDEIKHRKSVIAGCVTENSFIYLLLLILRAEGVINYGETKMCGRNGDPIATLRAIISASDIAYSDTLFALLECGIKSSEPAFIVSNDETPGEKLDKAIMLLSLLNAEDIYQFANDSPVGKINNMLVQSRYGLLTGNDAMLMAFFRNSHSKELCSDCRFKGRFCNAFDVVSELSHLGENCKDERIAMSHGLYCNIVSRCAMAGESCSSWLFDIIDTNKLSEIPAKQWIFEEIDENIEKFITETDGDFLFVLSSNDMKEFTSGNKYKEFRRHIVDSGALYGISHSLNSVFHDTFEADLVEIKKDGKRYKTRYFNGVCDSYDKDHATLLEAILGFDEEQWTPDNRVYRFVTADEISSQGYILNMELYNSSNWHSLEHPTKLTAFMKPIKGQKITSFELALRAEIDSLPEHGLDNYDEYLQCEWGHPGYAGLKYDATSLFIAKDSWPMRASFFRRKLNSTETMTGEEEPGIFIGSWLADKGIMAFDIDTSIANPWYVAWQLQSESSQFSLRSQNGRISVEQYLNFYIDLPSLDEQKKRVEEAILKEIDKKKRQIGAVDKLFDISHTIGLPANRIQMLLGNLKDMNEGNPEAFSQLKKIGDNFDYILRVISTASKDFKQLDADIRPTMMLPLIEKFRSSFSSLPFGFDPQIDRSKIDNHIKVDVDENLMFVLLDNILRNAHRHGFDKKTSSSNKVLFDFEMVSCQSRNWLRMGICNNGKKIEDDFSVYDYISEGKKGTTSGNTGQGGYDIYQIVRKFDGKLALRSTDEWNFIVDILLPVKEVEQGITVKEYTYGPLV